MTFTPEQAISQLRLQNAIVQMSKYEKNRKSATEVRELFVQTRACMDNLLEAGGGLSEPQVRNMHNWRLRQT